MVDPSPFGVGSRKFGTPCERMHSANLSAAVTGLEAVVCVGVLDDPQAAIATAQQVTASAITRAWQA